MFTTVGQKTKKNIKRDWYLSMCDEKDFENIESSTKMILLFAILDECEKYGEKILIFSQSIDALDVIEKLLSMREAKLGVDYFRLDGFTETSLRKQYIDSFNELQNPKARYISY